MQAPPPPPPRPPRPNPAPDPCACHACKGAPETPPSPGPAPGHPQGISTDDGVSYCMLSKEQHESSTRHIPLHAVCGRRSEVAPTRVGCVHVSVCMCARASMLGVRVRQCLSEHRLQTNLRTPRTGRCGDWGDRGDCESSESSCQNLARKVSVLTSNH